MMVQTRSNANLGTRAPHQGKNSANGGQHPPINATEAEALIQRVGITVEQFREVLAALTPNREIVVEDATGEPAGGKAGPAGSGGKKKKKVRRSQKKKATKPNGKTRVEDELSRLDEEDELSSFERASAFDQLGDPKSKKPRTSAFDWLQYTRSARKGDMRETLKERRGESSATSKIGSEEQRKAVEDKEAVELWRIYERLEKRLDAQNPYRQAVFSEVTPFSRKIMSCPLPDNFKTPQVKAYNGTTDPQDHLARFGANVVMWEKEARDVQVADDQALIAMLQEALPQGDVRKDLRRNPLSTNQEMLARAKYLALEDDDDEPPVRKEKKSGQPVAEGRIRKDFDEDYPPVLSPHWDALVIKVEINNVVVHRTLVDTGSSINIMYNNTFKELGLSRSDMKPIRTPLSGFTGDTIEEEGTITVKAGVGDGTHRLWLDMEFMVVQLDCAHHLILGRPGLEDLECVISPVHLCMKFITPTGVGVARGNQSLSRSCYVRATKSQTRVDENVSTICAAIQKKEGRPRAEPAEEVEEVALDPAKTEHKVKISKTLPVRLKEQLVGVLRSFKVLFPWGLEDMPRVDPRIICHRLAVDPAHRLAHPVHVLSQILIGTLLRSPNAPSRVSKWGVYLGSFQIEFKPRPAIKGQALADFVVECTARKVESNEEEPGGNWWTIYTHGSSTTDASRGGVVAISPEGFKAYYSVRFRFKVSNNEAEYEALLCGLRLAASLKAERIQVRCDSKLIVGHVTGEFEAKDERMKKYRDTALELLKAFGAYRIEQVRREENVEADILSKLGPDSPDHIKAMTQEEELFEPSISPEQVFVVTLNEPDWIDELTMYILDGSLPTDPIAARVVKRRAPSYTLECGRLYKRSYNGTLLRCLRRDDAQKLMEEIHEGICSAHQGAFTMSRKITLQGYFWPTIIRDYAEYVPKCKVCQEFQKVPGRPATNYTPISTSIPFARWGIDLVGILPRGAGNKMYLVVAIDYFTKWVEATPVPTITEEQMRKFVSKQIVCRFGMPQQIITDNGTQFEAKGFNEFLQSWGIKLSYVAVGYPQTNGQVENTNRTIVDGLKKRIMECKSA
ncbi:unnamed protein product [Cuscuta campestris]|uniref:Integrase catalytic domain-containing protein n=1 Tax=Cuscuta campestris TaxID=132261 RepID=A0A484NRU4_9ASTE|nr:unnamed protein product [Cuscuta campestris]